MAFRRKRNPPRRRSQTRLGLKPTVMESSLPRARLVVKPAIRLRRINRSRAAGLLVLALLIWIIYLLFDLDDFYVYEAAVRGNRILSAQEIYAASQVDSLSVFWVNPGQIAANVEALPNVKAAQVYLTLPANLVIEVEERRPEIIWQTGEAIWWIDNEGLFVPPRVAAEVDEKRLRIIDREARPVQVNDRIDLAVVRSAQIIQEHKPEVEVLRYDRQYGLSYITPEGWPVYLGSREGMLAKILVADAVRADLLARQVSPLFIDVRNPLRAVYEEETGF